MRQFTPLVCVGGPAAGRRCRMPFDGRDRVVIANSDPSEVPVVCTETPPVDMFAPATTSVYTLRQFRCGRETVQFLAHEGMGDVEALHALLNAYKGTR